MLPILQLGPLSIQTPGLILLLSLWIGMGQTEKFARAKGQNSDLIYNLILIALLTGIVGARLTYVARSLPAFFANPFSLFSLSPAMLNTMGGLIIAVLAGLIYGQRHRLPLWETLDVLTPMLAIVALGMGFAHLASGDAFGSPTSLPWGLNLWGEKRHPSQIYEILAAMAILVFIWPGTGRKASMAMRKSGIRFLIFLALTAGSHLFLEAFRGDSLVLIGMVRTTQVIAWFILAIALLVLGRRFSMERDHYGSNPD